MRLGARILLVMFFLGTASALLALQRNPFDSYRPGGGRGEGR